MIKFRKVSRFGHKCKNTGWETAKDEKDLARKMGKNSLAEIDLSSKKWYIRLLWRFFPPAVTRNSIDITYHYHNGKLTAETMT
jgi:hypothetical protein